MSDAVFNGEPPAANVTASNDIVGGALSVGLIGVIIFDTC